MKKMAETGMQYRFFIATEKADGTTQEMRELPIVATSTAQAWAKAGRWVEQFMNSPEGRRVTQLRLPVIRP